MHQFIARQPILDRQQQLAGYELLFRSSKNNVFPNISGDLATSQLVSNLFLDLNLDTLTEQQPAWINFDQVSLQHGTPVLLPARQVMIEVLESVRPGPAMIDTLTGLKARGYRLALDNFVPSDDLEPFVALADVIKLDIRYTTPSRLDKIQQLIHRSGNRTVGLLAEKVETHEQFEYWFAHDVSLFQGYFFCRPQLIENRVIAPTRPGLLQLLRIANRPGFDFDAVEAIIGRDTALIYKLLRYINSSRYGLKQEITSLRQALIYLGEDGLRRFINLLAIAGLASNKPDQLMQMALLRAKFAEYLAQAVMPEPQMASHAFLTGLLSLLDCMLNRPLASVIGELPVPDAVRSALISNQGDLARILMLIQACEQGNWSEADSLSHKLGLHRQQLNSHHLAAIRWTSAQSESLDANGQATVVV